MYLEHIHSPEDVKKLSPEQLDIFADEIRKKLLEVVSQNGGHLASNLGVVELTIALHRVFSCPKDSILFDVGHQSYVHKMLTGRLEEFHTLRTYGGISGFQRMAESPYDAFGAGHSSTSVSAAIGIATANTLSGSDAFTVAVIGDGAFTGGMAYEALNNCADNDRLIIILNDNTMSIAHNVGAMDNYLNRFRNSAKYFRMKNAVKHAFMKIPLCGNGLVSLAKSIKGWMRRRLVGENFFEHLGLSYYGPLDGNDEALLETVLNEAKNDKKCSVVHICTKKGKGYPYAEEHPDVFHGIGAFDPDTGELLSESGNSFSKAFGEIMCRLAKEDPTLLAISAAMPDGTGLHRFAKEFPERFFDVGIAEQHALTFACGLASKGYKPVFAVYSTFAQRAYDQLIHDCALQELPVILALDRAGLVGPDGATHHGIFDVAFLNHIPHFHIYAPDSYEESEQCLREALTLNAPVAIRYPKGKESVYPRKAFRDLPGMAYCNFGEDPVATVFTYGCMTENALFACATLYEKGIHTRLVRLVKLKPLTIETILPLAEDSRILYFLEEGIAEGGIGEHLFALLSERGVSDGKRIHVNAIDGKFPAHGKNAQLYEELGMSGAQVASEIERMVETLAD